MVLNVKPINNNSFDCFTSIIATICDYWDIGHYEIIFNTTWGFNYIPFDENNYLVLGDRIDPGFARDYIERMEKYLGVKITRCLNTDIYSTMNEIKHQIDLAYPVIIEIDTFWCPWSTFYKKHHANHYCLVIGVDDQKLKEQLICLDPYYTDKVEILPVKLHNNGIIAYRKLTFSKIDLNIISWRDLINETIAHVKNDDINKNAFYNIRRFADEIKNSFDLAKEIKGYDDLQIVPLFMKLKDVELCRVKLIRALSVLRELFVIKELSTVEEHLKQACKLWQKIRLLLIKMSITPYDKNKNRKLSYLLLEIADLEEGIVSKLTTLR